jgi:hypothetical protein
MKQGVEERLRILEARVALLEPVAPDGFAGVDARTQADLPGGRLARANRKLVRRALLYVLTSTALFVLSVVLTSGR